MSKDGGGFDPFKPFLVLVLIATCITAGFAIKFFREYEEWDARLQRELQNWRGYDPELDETKLQRESEPMRERIQALLTSLYELPKSSLEGGVEGVYQGIPSFIEERAVEHGINLAKLTPRTKVTSGVEEGSYTFDVEGARLRQLVQFLYGIEAARPILSVYEISNLRPPAYKEDDYEKWDCKITVAYRRAVEDEDD